MRRQLSVLYPGARSTLPPVLLALVLLAAVQIPLFWFKLRDFLAAEDIYYYPQKMDFVQVMEEVKFPFLLVLFLLPVLLAWLVNRSAGKDNLALKRLRVDQGTAALWMGAWNAGCLLLLWGVELVIVGICWGLYCIRQEPMQQELFLSFWQSEFLHSLLPLSDAARYLRNLACMTFLGIMSAMGWARAAWKKNYGGVLYGVALPALVFAASFSGAAYLMGDLLYSAAALLLLAILVSQLRRGEGEEARE